MFKFVSSLLVVFGLASPVFAGGYGAVATQQIQIVSPQPVQAVVQYQMPVQAVVQPICNHQQNLVTQKIVQTQAAQVYVAPIVAQPVIAQQYNASQVQQVRGHQRAGLFQRLRGNRQKSVTKTKTVTRSRSR
jgi:hypothetical protein